MKPETIELLKQNRDKFSSDTARLLDSYLQGQEAADEEMNSEGPPMDVALPQSVQGVAPQVSSPAVEQTPDYGKLLDDQKDPLQEYVSKGVATAEPLTPEAPPVDVPAPQKRDPALDAETYMPRLTQVESSGDPNAVSPKGAIGLTQITPPAMRDVLRARGEDDLKYTDEQLRRMAFNPEINRSMGKEYLQMQLDKYKDPVLALAAYNAGPGAVDEHGGVPPYKETQDYIEKNLGPNARAPEKMLNAAFEQQREANVLKAKSEIEAAKIDAVKEQEFQKIQEQKVAAEMETQQRYEVILKEADARRSQLQTELAGAAIDSDRWWDQKTTGQKILTVVGTAMMAVINPLAAVGMIAGAIDKDISDQRAQIATKQKRLDEMNGIYADLVKKTGDAQLAALEAKAIGIQKVRDHIKMRATQTGNEAVTARSMELDGKLQEEQAKAQQEADERLHTNMVKKAEALEKMQNLPGAQSDLTQLAINGQINPSALPKEIRERVVPQLGIANTKDDADKLKEGHVGVQAMNRSLDDLIKLREQNTMISSQLGDRSIQRKFQGLKAQLGIATKKAEVLGAYGRDVQDLITEMMVPEADFIGFRNAVERVQGIDPVVMKLKDLKDSINAKFEDEKKTRLAQESPQTMGRKVGMRFAPRGEAKP
jgi:hypothetical protein